MIVIEINGVEFDPSVMEIGVQDVSSPDAGRDLNGTMIPLKITTKQTVKVEWWEPTRTLVRRVLRQMYIFHDNGSYTPKQSFNVRYYDPITNTLVQKRMYVGDRTIPVRFWGDDRARYSKLSFNLIEI